MPIEILLMSAGAGKTEVALQRLASTIQAQPFAKVWVLVSGRRQEDAFRQRLIDQHNQQAYFNIEFFNFYQLYHRLLNIARQPPRKLDQAARFSLLRVILTQLKQENALEVYGEIATTPGFLRIMAELIYELKQNIVQHEGFLDVAKSGSAKDRDLALIYSRYQKALIAKKLVDREGEGWLALSLMRGDTSGLNDPTGKAASRSYDSIGSDVDLLLVDGYDQFTPLQANLLMLLAGRAHETLVTLVTVPGLENTVGQRFQRALEQLQSVLPESTQTIHVNPQINTDPALATLRHADLQHLCARVFRSGIDPYVAGEGIKLLEAPDIGREVGAILRRVRRLLLESDCQPDDILITLRDWPRYAGHFLSLGKEYDLPLAFHGGEPLAQNPAVIMLLNLLNLAANDFRRRDLLDVLRSPYFDVPGLDAAAIALLEQISREQLVTSSAAEWLLAIDRVARAKPAADKDDDDSPSVAELLQTDLQALHGNIAAFFAAVTPPQQASVAAYVDWVEGLIGTDSTENPDDDLTPEISAAGYSLRMPQQIRLDVREASPQSDDVQTRDLSAMQAFKRLLHSLLSAQELLSALGENREIDRDAFLLELAAGVNGLTVNREMLRAGKILITTVANARGLPHKHVFIPGLSESIFPAPVAEDPLYLDSDRVTLRQRGIRLDLQAERTGDDGLFYELIHLASESLTLSRPTVLDGGPWVASHLWRAVTQTLTNADQITEHIQVGAVTPLAEVASHSEALLSLAHHLTDTNQPNAPFYNWYLTHHRPQWQRMNHARRIELARGDVRQTFDQYSGRLSDPALIAYAAAQLSPDHVWSASQLNDYGLCGFRYFAKRLLKLDALEEPEEGLDARKLGTITHEILELTYREISQRQLWIVPENAETALEILHDKASFVLDKAPDTEGFRENALWSQEREGVVRRLEALIRLDFSAASVMTSGKVLKSLGGQRRRTYALEIAFGERSGQVVSIPIEVDGQPEALHISGFIDRVDQIDDGLLIVDYKTGSTPIPVDDMHDGRNFQMLVYLRAAQQLLANASQPDAPHKVLGGLFWHIRSQNSSGALLLHQEEGEAPLESAEAHIGRYIAAGRRGDFTVKPGKVDKGRCTHYCEFAQLCRLNSTRAPRDNPTTG